MISSDGVVIITKKEYEDLKKELDELEYYTNELEVALERANGRASSWERAAEEEKNKYVEAKLNLKNDFNFYRNWFFTHKKEIKELKNDISDKDEKIADKLSLRNSVSILKEEVNDKDIQLEEAHLKIEELEASVIDYQGLQETNYQLEQRLESQNTTTYEIIHPIAEDYGVNYSFGIGQNLENLDLFEDHWDLCQEIERGIRGLSDTELLHVIYKPLVGLIKI